MIRKPFAAATIAAASAFAVIPATSHAGHEPAVGALVGAAFGAAIGHGLGGHEGAVVGGVLGAITGASVASHSHYAGPQYYGARMARYPAAPVYYAPPPVVYRAPPVVVYPARPVRPVYAPVVVVRPGHGRSGHRHGRGDWR